MSDLPKGWTERDLASLGVEVRGNITLEAGTTYELYNVPAFAEGLPEVVDGSDVKSGKRPVQSGDLLVCKINPRINRVWIVGEPRDSRNQVASTEYLVLRMPENEPDFTRRFVMWYLRSPRFRSWIKLNVEGATGSHTRAKSPAVLRQKVPVAPPAEQQRIVEAIEEQFSRLDAGVESLQRAKRSLTRLRASILEMAGSPVIRAPNAVKKPLKELGVVVTGSTPSTKQARYWGAGTPFVTPGDLVPGGMVVRAARELTRDGAEAGRVVEGGSVLVTCIGATIGKSSLARVDCAINQQINAVVPRDEVDGRFLNYALASPSFQMLVRANASSTTMPILNKSRFSRLEVAVPSLDEQLVIVIEIERQLSVVDAVDSIVTKSFARADTLRHSVLREAFAGGLTRAPASPEVSSA